MLNFNLDKALDVISYIYNNVGRCNSSKLHFLINVCNVEYFKENNTLIIEGHYSNKILLELKSLNLNTVDIRQEYLNLSTDELKVIQSVVTLYKHTTPSNCYDPYLHLLETLGHLYSQLYTLQVKHKLDVISIYSHFQREKFLDTILNT